MAEVRDLRIDQGSKFEYTVNVTFEGVVQNLTGWTARLQGRTDRRATSPLLVDLAVGTGLTIVGPSGQVQIDIAGTVTYTYTWDIAQYDLTLYNGSVPYRVMQGRIDIDHTVTVAP